MDMILLQKMYDFRDTFVLECVHIENNAFRKDILNSWSYHKNIPNINVIILNVQV